MPHALRASVVVVKEQINVRAERIQAAITILKSQIKQVELDGEVAPEGCCVMRYQAQGSRAAYWYYKLQATQAIFPTSRDKRKKSKYKHLGKAGSPAHINAVIQVSRRARINDLSRAIKSLEESLLDVCFDD